MKCITGLTNIIPMDKKRQAVIALNNVSVIDRTFDVFSNDYKDFLELVKKQGDQPPLYPLPLQADVVTADIAAVFGNNISVNDRAVVIAFDLGVPATELSGNEMMTGLAGLLIQEQYKNFAQGRDHSVEVLPFRDFSPTALQGQLARKLLVTPSGSVNSVSEYVVLPATIAQNLGVQGTFAVGPNNIPIYDSNGPGKFAFMAPLPLRLSTSLAPATNGSFAAVLVVFKGLADYAAADLTIQVTPVFTHYQADTIMQQMIQTVL
jgi:hypothetical protein